MSTEKETVTSQQELSADELTAEVAADLPDRDAMSLVDPASLLSGSALTDPTSSSGVLNNLPSGASIPGIGNLGVSGLPRPSVPTGQ